MGNTNSCCSCFNNAEGELNDYNAGEKPVEKQVESKYN